jgi:hypothetical protein
MAVRLSALFIGRSLHPGIIMVLISVTGSVDPRATVRLERLGPIECKINLKAFMKLYEFCGFIYDVFSIETIHSVPVEWLGKFSEGSYRELMGVLTRSLPVEANRAVGLRKTKKNISIPDVSAEIRREHLPYTTLGPYRSPIYSVKCIT